MAAFLNDQLDFIFFFYGLAFVLLGATCWIAASRRTAGAWAMLGSFGFLHGLGEWLDLTALILGDSPGFAVVRMAVMTGSFMLLVDFARQEAIGLGYRMPGRWIYVILALAIALIAIADGPAAAGIVARYAIGFVGAGGAALVLACRSRSFTGGARGFGTAAAVGFALYAVTSGLIVPAGQFWPAKAVNYDSFTALTGMPVQLVRGLLACWISFSIWGIWGQREASDIASPRYTAYVRQQLVWTLAVMGAILVSGWVLTDYLGGIYRENVEREARSDIELLSNRLAGETATIEAMVEALAGSPSTIAALEAGSVQDKAVARSVLDLDIEATGAEHGYILDGRGAVVVSSNRRDLLPGAPDYGAVPDFAKAIRGMPTRRFDFDARTPARDYTVSYPAQDEAGRIVGVAVLTKSLAAFEENLRQFDRPYFLIDPDGVVVMTNRAESLYRMFWPLPEARRAVLSERFGPLDEPPMLSREMTDASWMTIDGERDFVRRRFINGTDWSLVILKPPREIFATRFLGIIITLLVTIMALIYLMGRARRVHDQVHADHRLHLQALAADLDAKATTDALTGLHNRLKLETVLADEMLRADRYGTPLTLILFDIDHFKAINDTYGHVAGDNVLVQLSSLVPDLLRSSDLLVRWGGEEFLILAPGIDGQMGYQMAEKCCKVIGDQSFGQVGRVTCSFGVAQYGPGETATDFIARADAALYRAKSDGRNQVKLAPARIGRRGLSSVA